MNFEKIKQLIRNFILVLMVLMPLTLFAQEADTDASKSRRRAEKKKEQRVQNAKKAEIKGKKRHVELQDKQTQKRMKRHKKKGVAYVSRRPGFFQRLFKPFR